MNVHLLDKKNELSAFLFSAYPERKFIYIIDSKIKLFHTDVAYDVDVAPIFAGERSKSIIGMMDVQNLIINSEISDPVMVVIGGGSVLDTCGFAISTFKKRLDTVFVPTTLSAQLEGFFKNEVYLNFDRIKDVMKVKFQPDHFVSITDFMKTQTIDEKKLSMIHAISFGLSHSKKFFDSVEKLLDSNLMSNDEVLKHIIFESLRMKANTSGSLVGEESGRAFMTASQLDAPYLIAMYYGVMIESFVSNKLGFLSNEEMDKVYTILKKCSQIHFDLSNVVDQLSYYEEPFKMKLPVKIGKTVDYQIFPGFLSEMIYSAHSKGLI
jgi:3-dehydroquinate synthetase